MSQKRQTDVIAELFPNYLVPAKEADPTTAFPTQYTVQTSYTSATAGNETTMFVGFDVPANAATTVELRITLAPASPGGYQWVAGGTRKLDAFGLTSDIVPGQLSWNNRPGRYPATPLFQFEVPVAGGDAVVLSSTAVKAQHNRRMDFEIAITRPGPGNFDWFELTSPKTGITLVMY
ncbi:hypothetical protein RUND412_003303 [Rhizina undulata]